MSDLQTLKDAYAAFATGDIPKVTAAFDPGIEWHEPDVKGLPGAGVQHGVDEVVGNFFSVLAKAYAELEVDPQRFIEDGNTIVALCRIRGVGAKSGNKFNVASAHVWKFENGKPVRFQEYIDTATLLGALYDTDKEGYPRIGGLLSDLTT